MFPRIVNVKKGKKVLSYLRVVENYRQRGKRKQRIIANFGRVELIGEKLGDLLIKLRKYTSELLVTPDEIKSKACLDYGPLLAGKKLWEETGLGKLLRDKFRQLKITDKGESQVLALVLNRLIKPDSELGMMDWLDEIYLPEFQNKLFGSSREEPKIRANRFYRCLDYLIREKENIEEHLWNFTRTLFPADIVFYDITNLQFEGDGPKIAKIGYPRLGKKNHNQVLLGLVVIEGLPVAHHVFRGNRAEKTTLDWVTKSVKKKYNVNRLIYVMDRGMITVENLERIDACGDGYIVGIKRRRNDEAKILLKENVATFEKIKENLFAKEIKCGDTRFVVCYNPERAKEEIKKRSEIIQELEEELNNLRERVKKGELKNVKPIIAKAEEILRHKHGKRYFCYEAEAGKFEYYLDRKNILEEEKLDGKFIIKTKEKDLTKDIIVRRYKDLSDVEEMFKELKDFLCVAPIYHYADRRVKAHILVCVLALFLQKYFEQKLEKAKIDISSEKAINMLKRIKVVINQVGHLTLKYVTPPNTEIMKILHTVGVTNLPNILSDITPVGICPELALGCNNSSGMVEKICQF